MMETLPISSWRPGTRAAGAGGEPAGATRYDPATAAHVVEEALECRRSLDDLWSWLRRFPYYPGGAPDPEVEDALNRALLALSAFRRGERSWAEAHAELLDVRARLSGLARHPLASRATPHPA
jgi:hypothetical protein